MLTVIPPVAEITEGGNILFICSIRGTPPVTFKIYHDDRPLFTTTSSENNTSYEIHDLGKNYSGVYYFEAINHANRIVPSERVTIEGKSMVDVIYLFTPNRNSHYGSNLLQGSIKGHVFQDANNVSL